MGITNPLHLAFIAIVALIVLGPRRLPEVTRALGNGMREFRDALAGEQVHEPEHEQDPRPAPLPPVEPPTVDSPPPGTQA